IAELQLALCNLHGGISCQWPGLDGGGYRSSVGELSGIRVADSIVGRLLLAYDLAVPDRSGYWNQIVCLRSNRGILDRRRSIRKNTDHGHLVTDAIKGRISSTCKFYGGG